MIARSIMAMTEPTAQSPASGYDPTGTRDFSLPTEPKRFRLDPDYFEAPASISAIKLAKFAEVYKGFTASDIDTKSVDGITKALGLVSAVFSLLLPGAYGERFVARLQADGSDPDTPPIDLIKQAIPVMYWLLEEYGMRPTVQSSPSLSESVTGDSADGAPAETSTGEESPAPLSS